MNPVRFVALVALTYLVAGAAILVTVVGLAGLS